MPGLFFDFQNLEKNVAPVKRMTNHFGGLKKGFSRFHPTRLKFPLIKGKKGKHCLKRDTCETHKKAER
jgi:hypothetical protein